MVCRSFLSLGRWLALLVVLVGQAQIRSVTRRTVQTPLGLPPMLTPAPLGAAVGNPTPAVSAPLFFRRPARRLPTAAELEERERVKRNFEIQCAERGMPNFQFSLAGRYLTGDCVPYDPERALELLRQAAAQDHPQARQVVQEYEKLLAGQAEEPANAEPPDRESDRPASQPPLGTEPAAQMIAPASAPPEAVGNPDRD